MSDLNIQSFGNDHAITRSGATGSQSYSNIQYEPDFHIVLRDNQHTLTLSTPVAIGDGTGNYADLLNKPSINGVELIGRLSFDDLGLGDIPMTPLSNDDIDAIMGFASNETILVELLRKGGTVELQEDITISSPIAIRNDTVLNLNRKKITYTGNGNFLIVNGAKLTIKTGSIYSNSGIAQAINGGEIVIQSGTYESGNIAFTILADSKIIVNNGSITAQNKCIDIVDNGQSIINGGNFNPEL